MGQETYMTARVRVSLLFLIVSTSFLFFLLLLRYSRAWRNGFCGVPPPAERISDAFRQIPRFVTNIPPFRRRSWRNGFGGIPPLAERTPTKRKP